MEADRLAAIVGLVIVLIVVLVFGIWFGTDTLANLNV